MLIYINFSFDFLGLDNVEFYRQLLRQWTHKMARFFSHLKHSHSGLLVF
jgi:hypothetical protein